MGGVSTSSIDTPCHVPRARRPFRMGILRLGPIKEVYNVVNCWRRKNVRGKELKNNIRTDPFTVGCCTLISPWHDQAMISFGAYTTKMVRMKNTPLEWGNNSHEWLLTHHIIIPLHGMAKGSISIPFGRHYFIECHFQVSSNIRVSIFVHSQTGRSVLNKLVWYKQQNGWVSRRVCESSTISSYQVAHANLYGRHILLNCFLYLWRDQMAPSGWCRDTKLVLKPLHFLIGCIFDRLMERCARRRRRWNGIGWLCERWKKASCDRKGKA